MMGKGNPLNFSSAPRWAVYAGVVLVRSGRAERGASETVECDSYVRRLASKVGNTSMLGGFLGELLLFYNYNYMISKQ